MDELNQKRTLKKIIQFPFHRQTKSEGSPIDIRTYCLPNVIYPVNAHLLCSQDILLSPPRFPEIKRSLSFRKAFLKMQFQFTSKGSTLLFISSTQVIHPRLRCYWARNSPRYSRKEKFSVEKGLLFTFISNSCVLK